MGGGGAAARSACAGWSCGDESSRARIASQYPACAAHSAVIAGDVRRSGFSAHLCTARAAALVEAASIFSRRRFFRPFQPAPEPLTLSSQVIAQASLVTERVAHGLDASRVSTLDCCVALAPEIPNHSSRLPGCCGARRVLRREVVDF
eukprot:3398736-Prymnesium_polylepis.1